MKFIHVCIGACLALAGALATAQTSSVTTVVVPAPAGGASDLIARVVVGNFQARGESFVIDNKGGANGMIGARAVASDPSLWMIADGNLLTVNPSLYPKSQGFDVVRDIKPVAGLLLQPTILIVRADSPWKTMADLVAAAKAGTVSFASGGVGSAGHLTMGLFAEAAGFKPLHVPYKGQAPAMTDLIGGQVDAGFLYVGGAASYIRSGKVRALAVANNTRLKFVPDVPTVAEAGLPNFRGEGAYFLMMSDKTPLDAREKVSQRVRKVMEDESVRGKLMDLGLSPQWTSAEDASKWIARERERNAKFISENSIRIEAN